MKLLIVPFAIAAAVAPATAAPAARPAVVAQQGSPAEQLVALLLPDDKMVTAVASVIKAQVSDESKFTPERRTLFATYPGFKDELVAFVSSEIGTLMLKQLPSLHAELATIISSEMTPAEIQQTLTFFRSPTGRKMLNQIYAGLAASGTTDEQEARSKAMATMMASLTPDDYPALTAFGRSSVAPKMQAIGPRMQAASKAWSDRFIQENGPALAARVDAMIAARKAKGQ
jgi:Uncharacterized protein conserved in bacteria (DUF2059)